MTPRILGKVRSLLLLLCVGLAHIATASGVTPKAIFVSGPPRNSTTNLRTPLGRGVPGWPPLPSRVATQRARSPG